MRNGIFLFGTIIAIFGIILFLAKNLTATIWGIILIIVGLALIIFRNEESKIEQRKDIKTKNK